MKRDRKERPSGELVEGRAVKRSKEDVEGTISRARARARVLYARSLTQPSVREGDDRVEFRVRERSKSSAGLGSHAGVQLVASASQARIISSTGPLVGSDLSFLLIFRVIFFSESISQIIRLDSFPLSDILAPPFVPFSRRDVT